VHALPRTPRRTPPLEHDLVATVGEDEVVDLDEQELRRLKQRDRTAPVLRCAGDHALASPVQRRSVRRERELLGRAAGIVEVGDERDHGR
jgi:hypothetical protein